MNNWKVWKTEKEYRRLFYATLVSGIGNRFTQVAILALIYKITSSPVAIGGLFVVRMLPFIFIAPFSGWVEQRVVKDKLLFWMDIYRVPFALMPIFVHHIELIWIIYVSAFFIAALEAIYAPVRMAAIPSFIKQDKLVYINAIEQILVGVVLVIGSSFGGVISHLFGLPFAFLLDAISFCISAYMIRKIQFPHSRQEYGQITKKRDTSVIKMICISGVLITFMIIEFTMPLANGMDNVLISVYALDVFQMGDLGIGFMYACLGLGFIISSFISKIMTSHLHIIFLICIGLEGVAHLFLSISPTFMLTLFIIVWITFVGGVSNICINTLIMKIVPKNMYGTFFGVLTMVSNISMAISMGMAGLFIEMMEPRPLSRIIGFTYIAFALLYAMLFKGVEWPYEKRLLYKKFR